MGHSSVIKGAITHVSPGFCRYLLVQHSAAAIRLRGGERMCGVPATAWRTPPAAKVVIEVASVEIYSSLSPSFVHESLVTPGMIHRTNNFCRAGRVQGRERENVLINCDNSSLCSCAQPGDTAGEKSVQSHLTTCMPQL